MKFINKSKTITPALILIIATVFYYIPSLVYFPNRDSFDNYFINLVAPILIYAVIAGIVIWLVLALIPNFILKYVTAILTLLALLLWLQGDLFAISYGILDGTVFDFSRFSQKGLYELGILGVALIIASIFHKFINKQLPFILLLIALCQISLVSYNIITEPEDKKIVAKIDQEFYNYSSKKNVILIIMDTFGAEYFEVIRRFNPNIVNDLSGFVNYTDAISNYPATKGSVPSLITGQMIPDDKKYKEFLTENVPNIGLPKIFEEKGYLVSVLSVYTWFHHFYTKRFMADPPLDPEMLDKYYGYRLLDLSLFRMMPHFVKPHIYKDGNWLLSGSLASQAQIPNTLPEKGEYMIRMMSEKAKLADAQERFKMIHVLFPHPEYVFNSDCEKVYPKGKVTDLMIQQSTCALGRLKQLIDKFKQLGIYDSSLIVVVSDHGSRVITDKSIHGFPSYFEMSASRPLFMVKGINQREKFHDVDTPVSLLKLYEIFVDEKQHKNKIDYLHDENRLFYSYRNQDSIGNGYLPDSPLFRVGKNAKNPKSWQLLKLVTHACAIEKIPTTIKITKDGREKYCAKFGFASPQTDGSGAWTESNDVKMIFKLNLTGKTIGETVEFNINFRPFIKAAQKQLTVDWYVNSQHIHSQNFTNKASAQALLKIPVKLLKSKELTELQIKFSKLTSQKEMRINSDSRKLGLFIKSIEIE
ncbi:MAG: sulfatase-like hydrolase/transferase [Proteobacteria bacterium]|nr:sulfatase-like hydrolase/transferase [Pseudomonadota bacterium]